MKKEEYYVLDINTMGESMTQQQAEDYAKAMATKHPSSTYRIVLSVGRTKHEIGVEWGTKEPDYRILEVGETIQEGDEYLFFNQPRHWVKCDSTQIGNKVHMFNFPHRRLINSNI